MPQSIPPLPQSRPSSAILPRCSLQCTSPSCWAWSGCCRSGRPPSLSCPPACCTWSSRSPGCGSPARTAPCTRSSSRCATCTRDSKHQPWALQGTCSRVWDRNEEYMLLNRKFWLCVTLPSALGLTISLALLLEGMELSERSFLSKRQQSHVILWDQPRWQGEFMAKQGTVL